MSKNITISQAIAFIQNNEIVALPTETVYGLFGLANSKSAVKKVFWAKNRPSDNPLICHFWSLDQISEYAIIDYDYIKILIKELSPGPITFLLKLKNNSLSPSLSNQTTICCRIPNHPITLEILKQVNIPLFGPSANTSTKVSGTSSQMVINDLGDRIAGIVDGGICDIGLESSIISCLEPDVIKILRPGSIGIEEIKQTLNAHNLDIEVIQKISDQKIVPGTKYRHYSPNCKIILESHTTTTNYSQNLIGLGEFINSHQNSNKELITGSSKSPSQNNRTKTSEYIIPNLISIGSVSNLSEVAHNLFQNLQSLDDNQIKAATFDLESWNYLNSSSESIASAIVNRLSKVIS